MRIKRGKTVNRRHKKILALAKGYRGGRSKLYKQAKDAVVHAGADAYRGRKEKKREERRSWQVKLNAAVREEGLIYSSFIKLLKTKKVELDRKILAELAEKQPAIFKKIIGQLKK